MLGYTGPSRAHNHLWRLSSKSSLRVNSQDLLDNPIRETKSKCGFCEFTINPDMYVTPISRRRQATFRRMADEEEAVERTSFVGTIYEFIKLLLSRFGFD